jgi:hypothetical protein
LRYCILIIKQKISIQKVHDTYQKRFEDADFVIKHRDVVVAKDDTIKSLAVPDGGIVLFRACLSDPLRLAVTPAAPPTSDARIQPANRGTELPASLLARRVKDEPHDNPTPFARP